MADRMLFIEGRWVDSASPEFQESMKNMKGSAQQTGQSIEKHIGGDAKKAMSQLGEKGEKARMMMTMMGGQMGAVGGQATYLASQVSFMVGKFKLWEVAGMAVVAGIAALGAAMYKLTTESLTKTITKIGQLTTEIDTLTKSIDDMYEAQLYAAAGLDRWDIERLKLKSKERALVLEISDLQRQMAEFAGKSGFERGLDVIAAGAGGMADKLNKARQALTQTQMALVRLAQGKELEGIVKGRTKGAAASGGRGAGGDVGGDWFREGGAGLAAFGAMGIDVGVMVAAGQARRALYVEWQDQIIQQARTSEELQTEIAWENALRREEIYANEARLAEEKVQHQMAVVENSIGIFSELGDVLTKGTKANTAVRIAAIVMEATYDAAVYTYKGIEELAKANPWAAAMHFAAAGMAAAVAAGKIAGAAGGGGGGASMSSRESAQGGWREQQQTKERGELHVHVWMGKKHVGEAITEAIQAEADRTDPGRKRTRVI